MQSTSRLFSIRLLSLLLLPACAGNSRGDESELKAPWLVAPAGRMIALSTVDLPAGQQAFPKGTFLSPTRMIDSTLDLGAVTALRFIDISRVIVAERGAINHLSIVDLASGERLVSFGRHGRGPGELQDPRWLWVNQTSHEFFVYDYGPARLQRYSVDPDGSTELQDEGPLSYGTLYRELFVSEQGILATGYFSDHTISMLNTSGEPSFHISIAPPSSDFAALPPVWRIRLNRAHLAVDPETKRFVLGYQSQPRLDFFDATGTYLGTVRPRVAMKHSRVVAKEGRDEQLYSWEREYETAYTAIAASPKVIAALFCGRCANSDNVMNEIHLFGWTGVPLARLQFGHEIVAFDISPDGRRIAAVVASPEPRLGVWEIPERFSARLERNLSQ